MTAFDNDKNVSCYVCSQWQVGAVEPAGRRLQRPCLGTAPVPETAAAQASAVVAVKGAPSGRRLAAARGRPIRRPPGGTPDTSTDTHLQSWTIPLASIDAAGSRSGSAGSCARTG